MPNQAVSGAFRQLDPCAFPARAARADLPDLVLGGMMSSGLRDVSLIWDAEASGWLRSR